MKSRFNKLPIVQLALIAGSLLIGLALDPVGAQQAPLSDGQVTIRSDGAVYLIVNGQRRWVATVNISDEELNAYPEAEPIYVGMAPFGSASAASKPTGGSTKPSSSTGSSSTTSASETSTPDPNGRTEPNGDSCPSSHQIKGVTENGVQYYYDPDRPQYPTVKPEACFTAGGDARNAGYKERK